MKKDQAFATCPRILSAEIIDLPGDLQHLSKKSRRTNCCRGSYWTITLPTTPDKVVVIVDATNVKRGFLLLTQIIDIGLPTILALNMMDLAAKAGIKL